MDGDSSGRVPPSKTSAGKIYHMQGARPKESSQVKQTRRVSKAWPQLQNRILPKDWGRLLKCDPHTALQDLIAPGFCLKERLSADLGTVEIKELLELLCRCFTVRSLGHTIKLLSIVNQSATFIHNLASYVISQELDETTTAQILGLISHLLQHIPTASVNNCTILLSQVKPKIDSNQGSLDSLQGQYEETHTLLRNVRTRIQSVKCPKKVSPYDHEDTLEPDEDFRSLTIFPTLTDILSDEPKFLRKNKKSGAYKSLEHYLDVQFRLLREDFIGPWRSGITELKNSRESPQGHWSHSGDIRVYSKVKIGNIICAKAGLAHEVTFDVSRLQKVNWETSKRLKYGSLVVISSDDFNTILLGVVVESEPRSLRKGRIDVLFHKENMGGFIIGGDAVYEMIESSSSYFEAYRHTLSAMQCITEADIPLARYIIEARVDNVEPPRYLQKRRPEYDLSCLQKIRKRKTSPVCKIPVLETAKWPKLEETDLDESQFRALQTALTKEFAIIQGPPGTGKTFIGLKIMQVLLENAQVWRDKRCPSPILVVCYTNHALDQFLEGVLEKNRLSGRDLVRMGKRSKSTKLERYSISNMRHRRGRTTGELIEAQKTTDYLSKCISRMSDLIDKSKREILVEGVLQHWMHPKHFQSLLNAPEIPRDTSKSVMFSWVMMLDKKCKKYKVKEGEADNQAEWEQVKKRQNKTNVSCMGYEEAMAVVNVWSLNESDRLRLYHYWFSQYLMEEEFILFRYYQEYDRATQILAEKRAQADLEVLQNALVVGMTTTGAAKNRSLLKQVSPRIIIVEEAAEVLEAHIVTSLSEGCQHLILIGDHLQLRPSTAVYHLAKRYHLDVSLFERMVINEMRCDQLAIQHRMRPEIVKMIVPHIYKELENHPSVYQFEGIKGILGNIFFITHSQPESHDANCMSYSNKFEANYLVRLLQYILQQGYSPDQVTILTAYTGQMFSIKNRVCSNSTEMSKVLGTSGVRVTPVDNFQGEENDIVLLSLVRSNSDGNVGFVKIANRICVALSRARKGLFILGCMDILRKASNLWQNIATAMEDEGTLVKGLPLSCQKHPDTVFTAECPEDFDKAPLGGCMRPCGYHLECGHECILKCHPYDQQHTEYSCRKPCRRACKRGHLCPGKCCEECPECVVLVEKIVPKCGHQQMIPCHKDPKKFICTMPCETKRPCGHSCMRSCGESCPRQCQTIVPDREWPCHHTLSVECWQNPDNFPCNKIVQKTRSCGHSIQTACSSDPELSAPPCQIIVPDREWPCHHILSVECWKNPDNFPCNKMVQKTRSCGHSIRTACSSDPEFSAPICQIIVPDREWPCHHKLSVECWKNPDNFPCNKRVQKTRSCGHSFTQECSGNPDHSVCLKKVDVTCQQNHVTKVDCYKISSGQQVPCKIRVKMKCVVRKDHTYWVECASADKCSCPSKCEAKLACGHLCPGVCGECSRKKEHKNCTKPCGEILPCGHQCAAKCSEPCPPCQLKCETACPHNRCHKECWEVCEKCLEPCSWSCEHYTCFKRCWEPCSRPPCNEPCKKLLRCRHKCRGLCGEPCPPVCSVCFPKFFQHITGQVTNAKIITLKPCNHSFEVDRLDQIFSACKLHECLIRPKCPKCQAVIGECPRYNTLMKTCTVNLNRERQKQLDMNKEKKKQPFLEQHRNAFLGTYHYRPSRRYH